MFASRWRALVAAELRNGHPAQNSIGTVSTPAVQRAHVESIDTRSRTNTTTARGPATTTRNNHERASCASGARTRVSSYPMWSTAPASVEVGQGRVVGDGGPPGRIVDGGRHSRLATEGALDPYRARGTGHPTHPGLNPAQLGNRAVGDDLLLRLGSAHAGCSSRRRASAGDSGVGPVTLG